MTSHTQPHYSEQTQNNYNLNPKMLKLEYKRISKQYDILSRNYRNLQEELNNEKNKVLSLQKELLNLKEQEFVLDKNVSEKDQNDSFDDISWWEKQDLSKIELDAYVSLVNQLKIEISELKKELKHSEKQTKYVEFKNRLLEKKLSFRDGTVDMVRDAINGCTLAKHPQYNEDKNNSPITESSNKCSRPEKTLSQKCMEKAKKRHEERLKIKLSKKVVSKLNTINETPSEDESKMNDYSVNTPSYPVNNISEEVIIEDKNKNNDLTKEQIKEENNDKPCDIDYIPEPWEQLYDNIGRPYFFNKCTRVSTWTLPECSVATSVANAVANAAAVDAAKAVHEANLAVESAQKKEQDTEQNQTAYVASTSYDEQEYIPCEVECEEECKVDNANISIKKDSLNEDYLSYINSTNYSEPEILYNTSFKTVFPKESEHIFRNCCLKILHGKIPSYSVWGQLDYFDVTYWDGFDEHQCYQLVSSLWHNYSKDYKDLTERINILHANIPADISASNNTYNYILKDIVSWLFA